MTQKIQRQHAFTISLILNRIIERSLTKPLASPPLAVSESATWVWEESSLRTNEINEGEESVPFVLVKEELIRSRTTHH